MLCKVSPYHVELHHLYPDPDLEVVTCSTRMYVMPFPGLLPGACDSVLWTLLQGDRLSRRHDDDRVQRVSE